METKKQFLDLLNPVYRQLFIARIFKEGQLFLLVAGIYAILLFLLARLVVFPFMLYWLIGGQSILFSYFIYRTWKNRGSINQAAKIFDVYVGEDRVVTALSFLDKDGILQELLLRETVSLMKKVQKEVLKRKKKMFYPKPVMAGSLFIAVSIFLLLHPNEQVELAKEKEKEAKMLNEAEKRLEKIAKEQKKPEVRKEIEKVLEQLEKKETAKAALKELEKQAKQLELRQVKKKQEQQKLQDWQEQLEDAGMKKLSNALKAEDMDEIEKQLEKLNKNWSNLTDKQKKVLSEFTQTNRELSEEELAMLAEQIKEALAAGKELTDLAAANAVFNQEASNLLKQMEGTTSGQLALNPSPQSNSNSNQNASPSGNGSPNKNGTAGNGSGQSGSGQSNGSGGSGNGSGNGGSGSGSGTGNSSGSGGSAAGKGAGSRDFLTVPHSIDGKENIENDSGNLGVGSSQQSEGNGPILRGQIRSYKEVYGQYAEAYRKSSDRVKLPSELENIVKNYFTNINPDKE